MQVQYRPQKNEISRMKFLTKTYCLCKPGFTERYKKSLKIIYRNRFWCWFYNGYETRWINMNWAENFVYKQFSGYFDVNYGCTAITTYYSSKIMLVPRSFS